MRPEGRRRATAARRSRRTPGRAAIGSAHGQNNEGQRGLFKRRRSRGMPPRTSRREARGSRRRSTRRDLPGTGQTSTASSGRGERDGQRFAADRLDVDWPQRARRGERDWQRPPSRVARQRSACVADCRRAGYTTGGRPQAGVCGRGAREAPCALALRRRTQIAGAVRNQSAGEPTLGIRDSTKKPALRR